MAAAPDFRHASNDPDSVETEEWLDALLAVLEREGPERAHFIIEALIDEARRAGINIPYSANTAYINTIPESTRWRWSCNANRESSSELRRPHLRATPPRPPCTRSGSIISGAVLPRRASAAT